MSERILYTIRVTNGFMPQKYEHTDALSALKIINIPGNLFHEIYRERGETLEKIDLGTLEFEASLL
ncbi:MAG: hypothetical protein GTN39_02970 [Candidatus Aenigmarchaeota archaeon]|nr:hypothetical protein [Candidatus Aenigmarchaeota archaeon]